MVIILRGLPGSGKTWAARLIKDVEVQNGGVPPRTLSLDDYFLQEQDVECDHDDDEDNDAPKKPKPRGRGRKHMKTVMVYEYEPELEDAYRQSAFKAFQKNVREGFFPFIIVDNCNIKCRHFEDYWSFAKSSGFEVYVLEMHASVEVCAKRNVHNRTLRELVPLQTQFEPTPPHYIKLTLDSLLHDDDDLADGDKAVPVVEMDEDDFSNVPAPVPPPDSEAPPPPPENGNGSADTNRKAEQDGGEEEGDDALTSLLGAYTSKRKRRVRWADLEGFTIGQPPPGMNPKRKRSGDDDNVPVIESKFTRRAKEEQRVFAASLKRATASKMG